MDKTRDEAGLTVSACTCIYRHIAVPVCVLGLFNKLLGILCTTLEKALENAFLRIESPANIVGLIYKDSQVAVQKHHDPRLFSVTGYDDTNRHASGCLETDSGPPADIADRAN